MIIALIVVLLTLVSMFGVSINCFLFYKFYHKPKNDFLKYCLAKTVPNIVVCSSFLFWVVPLTALSLSYLQIPRFVNALIGQSSGFGAYVAGALIEFFMAFNRCSVIFFPTHNFKFANHVIAFVFLFALGFTLMGLIPKSCGFVYDPEIFTWRPEDTPCAELTENLILYTIVGISGTANTMNVITFVRLVHSRVDGINDDERARRQKRAVKLFGQSVIQNCLHVVDMVNFNFIAPMNSATWFQFTLNSMSLLSIHAVDGLVMYIFHPEVQPRSKRSSSVVVVTSQNTL